jgi:hypothetical protein
MANEIDVKDSPNEDYYKLYVITRRGKESESEIYYATYHVYTDYGIEITHSYRDGDNITFVPYKIIERISLNKAAYTRIVAKG